LSKERLQKLWGRHLLIMGFVWRMCVCAPVCVFVCVRECVCVCVCMCVCARLAQQAWRRRYSSMRLCVCACVFAVLHQLGDVGTHRLHLCHECPRLQHMREHPLFFCRLHSLFDCFHLCVYVYVCAGQGVCVCGALALPPAFALMQEKERKTEKTINRMRKKERVRKRKKREQYSDRVTECVPTHVSANTRETESAETGSTR